MYGGIQFRFIHWDNDPSSDLGYTHRISVTAEF